MRFWCVSLAACLGLALQVRAELAANGIKAVVHDAIVTFDEVEALTGPAAQLLWRKYYNQPEQFQKELDKVRDENLKQLIKRQLILHEFATAGYSLPESVVDELVQEEIRAEYTDRRTLTKTLQARGTTYEQFRQRIRDKFIERALIAKNISQEIIVSPHKVETYYLTHREEFKVEDEVKVRILTLPQSSDPSAPSAQKLAEEIYARLKGGATFAEMAALYSQGGQAKQEGVWYEASQLTKHLADVTAGLQPGQHSPVMSRSTGQDCWVCQYEGGRPILGRHYTVDADSKEKLAEERKFETANDCTDLPPVREFFLLLVEDKRAAHYKPLSEVRSRIEEEFKTQERARLEKQWLDRLKKKTFVRIFPGG